jgi:peptidoglycan/LPS O-acetylase OafA/YrhL
MKIEFVPLIIGALVGLLGLALLFDAWTPDAIFVSRERRRRPRARWSRVGESFIGFGVIAMACSILGRDNWRYSTLVVVAGTVALILGVVLSRSYVRELFVNRGPLRRRGND